MLGTSDTWSMSHSSLRTSVDCRIYVYGVQVAKIGHETELEIRKKIADGCFPADQTGCQKQATFLSQLE